MIYQVRANVYFERETDANKYVAATLSAINTAVVVHPDEPNQQGCSVELIKCYHDQTPTRPCIPWSVQTFP